MSLRLRVALFTAAGTSLLMVLGSLVVIGAFRTDQIASVDSVLAAQYQVLAQPAATAARLNRPRLEELANQRLVAPAVVRVWQGDRLLLELGAEDLGGLPAARTGYSTLVGESARYRAFSETVEPTLAIGRGVDVEVAMSLEQVDAVYERMRTRLRRVVVLGVGLFGLAGWVAAAGALAPLARLRKATEHVTATNDLTTRVGSDQGPREVKELAASFEAMLARLQQAGLQREEALESARTFAAAAAHELRTPITSIGANLEVLSAHPEVEDREDLVADLVAEHRRLVGLLEALRLLSRGDLTGPEAFEDLDLADLVEQTVDNARRRDPTARITVAVPEGPIIVRGWPEGLRLMIDNLVANAITHGRSAEGSAEVTVALTSEAQGISLTITDRGPGVPVEERGTVMGRFVRGSSAQGAGSGLGLALAAQQARIHGGSITIDDAPGGGAAITFRLP
ncbi:MAG: HAMP domain-containing histidine kinase [Actinomycetota bacterium]|nr:HAMP domain-containing histidine kinase [Actinomycetota bacterium]